MQNARYGVLLAGWLVWVIPFFLKRHGSGKAVKVDRRARWGILLEAVGFSIVWQGSFWQTEVTEWRFALSIAFLLCASLLSWGGTLALGRHWRIDAGLSADHQLVRSGAYRVVRHPIYASMLCLVVATGLMVASLPLLASALAVFIAGTEIRVRVEDSLLAGRFGAQFEECRRAVPAYIPLVR